MSRQTYLNQPINYKEEFTDIKNIYFMGTKVTEFDALQGEGKIKWECYKRDIRYSFNQIEAPFKRTEKLSFFPEAYLTDHETTFRIYFYSENTIRVRIATREGELSEKNSLMLLDEITPKNPKKIGWEIEEDDDGVIYRGKFGAVKIKFSPWNLIFLDNDGNVLTATQNIMDTVSLKNDIPIPFSYLKKPTDRRNIVAGSFTLSPDEKIFGCGESFTRLNKRGQKLHVFVTDPLGTLVKKMYKPIPFYLSSRGYGMFVHTSAPLTFDFGETYDSNCVIYSGDEEFDFFLFIGNPKKIVNEYTAITGRAPMPPLWSFGLWMSRISYFSEKEIRDVAEKLRKYKIPADVIHIDTGWFEEEWKCDYQFSKTRFPEPEKMIKDLDEFGFKISLWQIPYFTPKNPLYGEIIKKGYTIKSPHGGLPTDDAILDFTNEEAVNWYKEKIASLLKMGVGAIKADFGEAAPFKGIYHNNRSGMYEHNLYPLRYNKIVSEITKDITGNPIIWARSAWTGSQRYPLHWGGDAEITNNGMAATLRAGLSLGLCGFTFWSHDLGGFTRKSPKDLYARWLCLGMFTSHCRAHGQPPKEPWEYDEEFVDLYRESMNLRYSLMPYIYTQAFLSSKNGWPMMRTLFFEFENDPTAWYIEDQYLFGSDFLIAPLFENKNERNVYLPEGNWVDYQTNKIYQGNMWHTVKTEKLPILIFVREGAVIPHTMVAQNTREIDWEHIELRLYGDTDTYSCYYYAPNNTKLGKLTVHASHNKKIHKAGINENITFRIKQ